MLLGQRGVFRECFDGGAASCQLQLYAGENESPAYANGLATTFKEFLAAFEMTSARKCRGLRKSTS